MRRLLIVALVCAGLSVLAPAAQASVFTFSDTELSGFDDTWSNPSGGTLDSTTDVAGLGVEFDGTLASSSGFSQVQLGYDMFINWDTDLFSGDLTGYDTYQLVFENTSDSDWVMVNLFLNEGWTDAPWSEPNVYHENTWTWLAPGASASLSLDLTGLTYGGTHISGIGVNIGSNYGSGDYYADAYSVKVAAVPVPGALILGLVGIGLVGAAKRIRR
jgi:hypothetical protein